MKYVGDIEIYFTSFRSGEVCSVKKLEEVQEILIEKILEAYEKELLENGTNLFTINEKTYECEFREEEKEVFVNGVL